MNWIKKGVRDENEANDGAVGAAGGGAVTADTVAIVRELAGVMCACGARKMAKQTFCSKCYFKLSPEMRKALYRRLGSGYVEAYQAACAELRLEAAHAQP